jgi:hypothetical protein
MIDRLTLARALEESGMGSTVADRVASEIYNAIHDNVATKSDVASSAAELKTEIGVVRSELAIAIRDLKIWTGSLFAAGMGLLFAALHYWPPR